MSIPPAAPVAKDRARDAYLSDPRPHKAWLCGGACLGPGAVFTPCPGFEAAVSPPPGDPSSQPTAGDPAFNDALRRELSTDLAGQVLQTVGGTGALRLALTTWRRLRPHARLWLTKPSWSNHAHIGALAGFSLRAVPWQRRQAELDLDAILGALQRTRRGDLVMLHGVAHHPTGLDPTPDGWRALAKSAADHGWVPLIDVAFTGLAGPLFTDLQPVAGLARSLPLGMVALSLAKSTGLHAERPGALTVFGGQPGPLYGHLLQEARGLWAAPPREVALKVERQLRLPVLRAGWSAWLRERRTWLNDRREALATAYEAEGMSTEAIRGTVGVFVPLGLSPTQAQHLCTAEALYVGGGYVNLSSLRGDMPARLAGAVRLARYQAQV